MASVMLGSGARAALNSLTSIQGQMDVLQKRLATGKRVNSPIDNPNAYFLAQSLTNRASSLMGLGDNISSAKSAVTAAANGIAAIKSLLISAQSIANTALQSPQSLVTVTGNHAGALTAGSTIATTFGSATRFRAGDTVTVSDGTTTATYTAANNDDVQDFLDAINNTANLNVTASLNASGQIQLASNSNVNVTIGGSINGAGGGTLGGIIGLTAGTTTYTINTTRQSMAAQFASLRAQIDAAAQDASINGVNLLGSSSLSVSFNESGSSAITLGGVSMNSSTLGVSAGTNNWQLDSDINASIAQIGSAITSLQTYSATFSAMSTMMNVRGDFNQSMIDILNGGADGLTANDSNEDSAMLLALQTRQQVAITALSLVQSSQSTALRLFDIS